MLGEEESDDVVDAWLEQSERFDNDVDELNQSLSDRLIDRFQRFKRLCNPLATCLSICLVILLTFTIIAWRDRPVGLSPPGVVPPPFYQTINYSTNQSINEPRLKPRPSLHASSCAKHYPSDQSLQGTVNQSYRYYFAINFFNNDEILPDFFQELHRLFTAICEPDQSNIHSINRSPCANVFVSIYESGSADQTKKELAMFTSFFIDLGIPHSIQSDNQLIKKSGLYRIDHLAAVRNMAMAPFFEQHEAIKQSNNQSAHEWKRSDLLYDKLIWMNDIIYCAEDVIRLINQAIGPSKEQSTNQANDQSNDDEVHMVCGLDFWEHAPISFYDTWVMRGLDGQVSDVDYPWFSDPLISKGIKTMTSFPVFCCWNGLVVMSAWEWLKYGIAFRSHDDETIKQSNKQSNNQVFHQTVDEQGRAAGECDASECSHICEQYWAIHGSKTHIIVDPLVNVAYRFDVYQQIEQQHWFDHSSRHQSIKQSINQIKTSLQQSLIDHTPVPWKCRDLDYHYSDHPVTIWADQEKSEQKVHYEEQGWAGWKQIEHVKNFGK